MIYLLPVGLSLQKEFLSTLLKTNNSIFIDNNSFLPSSHAKGLGVILCHSSPSDITRQLSFISVPSLHSSASLFRQYQYTLETPCLDYCNSPSEKAEFPRSPCFNSTSKHPFPTWPITPNCYIKYGTGAAHLQIFPTDVSFLMFRKPSVNKIDYYCQCLLFINRIRRSGGHVWCRRQQMLQSNQWSNHQNLQ